MEQFRQIGEVLGSLKALMVLQDEIPINPTQCCLLLHVFTLAFDVVAEEIKRQLKLDERKTKWKPLEGPLRELCRIFREGEVYIRRCLDSKYWWGKAVCLHQNRDSVEFHIHNLVSHFPAVIEAIEIAGSISGLDEDEMQKKRVMLLKKYDSGCNDPKLFEWMFGRQYLVTPDMCGRIEKAVREDRWHLVDAIKEKKKKARLITKHEQRIGDMLLKKLTGTELVNGKLPPMSVLVGAEDYQVRRRLGEGRGQYKEIQWLGESFALRHFFQDIEPLVPEISILLSLSHPNIVRNLCAFYDEEKKECSIIMELMSKDLRSHMNESTSLRRRALFPLPVVVDMMLQVARGMEYLHLRTIYVRDLNPSNIFLKPRKAADGYFTVKVSGYGLRSVTGQQHRKSSPDHDAADPRIWYAPEVLAQLENPRSGSTIESSKYTEKGDVYSFAMLCFELLTGKPPFEDGHLQGDQMIKTITTGGRPLFPSLTPRYLVNLTKKCWHTDPGSRPSFTSICRILRYIKKFIALNPNYDQPGLQAPSADYSDLEGAYLRRYPTEASASPVSVSQIPFQMFAYRLSEKERSSVGVKFKMPEPSNEAASNGWDENFSLLDDPAVPMSDARSCGSDIKGPSREMKTVHGGSPPREVPDDLRSINSEPAAKKILLMKKSSNVKIRKLSVKPKIASPPKSSPWSPTGQSLKIFRESPKHLSKSAMSPNRRPPVQPPHPEKSWIF